MDNVKIKRALISVSDKDGVVELAKYLDSCGVEIISTSRTAKLIQDSKIKVTKINDVTSFPEILGGRVKTLHPNVFGGILARREVKDDLEALNDHKIKPIDMIVVNLYPFYKTVSNPESTIEDAIENIDIGGPSMVRASAKNHKHVAVVTDPADYNSIIEEMKANNCCLSFGTRAKLALKAFHLTYDYDSHIVNYLDGYYSEKENDSVKMPEKLELTLERLNKLRYGENPHQNASLYSVSGRGLKSSLAGAKPIQGKEISYNNLIDSQGAVNVLRDIEGKNVAAIIKHTNPCGVGRSENNLLEAYELALECDPVSAFGGIVCLSGEVNGELATEIKKLFTEVVIAPAFSDDALKVFAKKKNLRLIELDTDKSGSDLDFKFIDGGVLIQEVDLVNTNIDEARIVTERKPDPVELKALKFAMDICKNVKSNAIVLANEKQSVGIGAGQTSRVDSCEIAFMKAKLPIKGAVLASDAFFPFRDSIDLAAGKGIKAVIQPGGSLRDEEVIQACNEHGISMLFTGKRHFKH